MTSERGNSNGTDRTVGRIRDLSRKFVAGPLWVWVIGIIGYVPFVSTLSWDPPGFYIDEAFVSLNAYLVATTGRGEFGQFLPLYFPAFKIQPPYDYLGYADPVQIYLLAFLYLIFSPSNLLIRLLSSTAIYAAAIFSGDLAARITGRLRAGVAIAIAFLATPWFFEISRLGFPAPLYALAVALLLNFIYRASEKRVWSLFDCGLIGSMLALTTYTYSIGRLLGPLLAIGLLIFATNKERLLDVAKTWAVYGLLLVPLAIFHFNNPNALLGRFNMSVGIVKPQKGFSDILLEFGGNYFQNISLASLLSTGDPNLRHHITDMAPFLCGVFVLSVIGIIVVVSTYIRQPWWRYIVYGAIVSVVPSSLTNEPFHMLRLIAFPVFLIVLAVPAVGYLLEAWDRNPGGDPKAGSFRNLAIQPTILRWAGVLIAALIAVQAIHFHINYWETSPKRGLWFDDAYPRLFEKALAEDSRPIYLVDGMWGPAYVHGLWSAATRGIELSDFEHVAPGSQPPDGALVLSSEDKCSDCQMIDKEATYLLYRKVVAGSAPSPALPNGEPANAFQGGMGRGPGQFQFPHGIALDDQGNIYIADSDNSRVQKFNAQGVHVSNICQGLCRSPKAVAIIVGHLLVVDSMLGQLLKLSLTDYSEVARYGRPEIDFDAPTDIAFSPEGDIFVADQGRARVVRLSPVGDEIGSFGSLGIGEGQFTELTSVAYGVGQIYVADAGNRRLQIFNDAGSFLSSIPVPEWQEPKEGWRSPHLFFDAAESRLYATSTGTNEIIIFDPPGKRLAKISGAIGLLGPTGMARGRDGKLYVINTTGSRITKLDTPRK